MKKCTLCNKENPKDGEKPVRDVKKAVSFKITVAPIVCMWPI